MEYHCDNCYRDFNYEPIFVTVKEKSYCKNNECKVRNTERIFCSEDCKKGHINKWEAKEDQFT